jgi:hypothetical protein
MDRKDKMKNTSSETETTVPPESGKRWYQKPDGTMLLTVLACIILVWLAYYFGWTGPRKTGQQAKEQTNTVTRTENTFSEPDRDLLRDRLISCLDRIDKRIMPAFRAGTTSSKARFRRIWSRNFESYPLNQGYTV